MPLNGVPLTTASAVQPRFAAPTQPVRALTILAPLDEVERATLHGLLTKITAELPQPTRS
jgi:hypothetical protein